MGEPAVNVLLDSLSQVRASGCHAHRCAAPTGCARAQEVRELGGTVIDRIECPTPLEFLVRKSRGLLRCACADAYRQREYVAPSRPCIITGVVGAWPASTRWCDDGYLCAATGSAPVAVNVTPHGRGDAVLRSAEHGCDVFTLPCEERMPFSAFLSALDASLDDPAADSVPYVSAQDGSLSRDFPALAADVPAVLPWAAEALGTQPDAVNLWCGNDRSVSSFHHDHYENLYAVVVGEKRFTLLPPCDSRLLRCRRCKAGRFGRDDAGAWRVALDDPPRRVSWATVNPHGPDASAESHAAGQFVEVTVRAGEMLYLPSLWHHHVRQSGRRVIAVNWWHDMKFDLRYAYFQFVRKLGDDGDTSSGEDTSEEDEEEEANTIALVS
jgi:jumonji domain-containing protein 7